MSSKVFGMHTAVGRGVFAFAAGAAIAGLSLILQQAFLRAAQGRS